jgi:hypothetical protein
MKSAIQKELRILVKARDEVQALRKRFDNRMGKKADGTDQNVDAEARAIESLEVVEVLNNISENTRDQERKIEKTLAKTLKSVPVYTEWIKKQKGVGPVSAGWILAEFDIHIADTVSKLWQYAGVNPGLVPGKKSIKKKDYKPAMGKIIQESEFKGETQCIVLTDEFVRGDRLTPGFVSPFNKRLKTALMGVLASSFIKARAPYRTNFYDPYKERLKNEESPICNPDEKRVRKDDGKQWKDVSDGHRDMAARRYMIKMFLKDLYVAWRQIEGLSVRSSYAEEYLGKRHAA